MAQQVLDPAIRGQETAQRILVNTLASLRIPHSILLHGPSGSGKYTLARSYAAALNCLEPVDRVQPCRTCVSCRQMETMSHADFSVIEADGSTIKIDQIREVIEGAYLKPYSYRRRVSVIKHAELMTEEAANCMLKLLEEPPPTSHLILTSTDTEALMDTILSRCLKVRLVPVAKGEIVELLCSSPGVDRRDAERAAAQSGGDVPLAIRFMDQSQETETGLSALIGVLRTGEGCIIDLLDSSSEAASLGREGVSETLASLELWLRDSMVFGENGTCDNLINSESLDEIKETSLTLGRTGCMRATEAVTEARKRIAHSVNLGLVLDDLYLRLYTIASGRTLSE